jgi:hypothetical protein
LTADVVMRPSARTARARRNLFAAGLMLALYVALQSLAASEALHHCLHEDSHAPEHQCVIKHVADGQLLAATAAECVSRPVQLLSALVESRSVFIAPADGLFPPGRAPPRSPA